MVEPARDILTLWTNDPARVAWAGRHGIDRVGLDLETLGKAERQQGLPTWISPHRIEDLARIAPLKGDATLFVRCDPLHAGSERQIDAVLDAGVGVLMLPNFTTAREVESFVRIVAARARVVPLIERRTALDAIEDIAALGVDEVHIGLNDLSIDLGLSNRLVAMASDEVEDFAERARGVGVRFGLGGLGRALDETLPVPSDIVYAQHARLGASGALLARSFFTPEMMEHDFAQEMTALRTRLEYWRDQPPITLEQARRRLMNYIGVAT